MTRTEVTYGQLDKALRSLGFTCRKVMMDGEARRYEHAATGALILLPPLPESDGVLDYHLVAARTTLETYGIADPQTFAVELQRPI